VLLRAREALAATRQTFLNHQDHKELLFIEARMEMPPWAFPPFKFTKTGRAA
jgi:hypothetical protein